MRNSATLNSLNMVLSITQLQQRWNGVALKNIYELADQGYFGLYAQSTIRRRRAYSIIQENPIFEEKPYLFESKDGYVRLATKAEVDILPLSESGSIAILIRNGGMDFFDYNNVVGFVYDREQYVANSYSFYRDPPSHLRENMLKNYKGYFGEEDLFVFEDQIKAFETTSIYLQLLEKFINNPKQDILKDASNQLLRDENLKYFETGRFTAKQRQDAARAGGKAITLAAKENAKPYLNKAYETAKRNNKKFSAHGLAEHTIKKFDHRTLTKDTLRKWISKDDRIKPYLKLRSKPKE